MLRCLLTRLFIAFALQYDKLLTHKAMLGGLSPAAWTAFAREHEDRTAACLPASAFDFIRSTLHAATLVRRSNACWQQ